MVVRVLFHTPKRLLVVQFWVRAHFSVLGSIPGWDVYGRKPIDVSLLH